MDEIAEYGKVTVDALGRLETRFHQPESFEYKTLHTSRSWGSIASQLSRIESLLSVGQGTPNSIRPRGLSRTGSASSLHSAYSASPLTRSESRRHSISSSPTRASKSTSLCEQPGPENVYYPPPPRLFGEPKPSEDTAALDFFHAFESLVAHAGGSISRNLTEYMRYHQIVETTQAHIRLLSAFVPHLDLSKSSTMNSKFQETQKNTLKFLESAESEKQTYREACWRDGYDMDELDRALKATVLQDTFSSLAYSNIRPEPPPEYQHQSWWDVLHHVGPQTWLTKNDRINSWLLQNLAAQPSEGPRHRQYLTREGISDQLSEEEWARLVLKFWTLDDAARPEELVDCSTIGAVDSDGARHSVRVKLAGAGTQSLPIRERKSGERLEDVEMDVDDDEEEDEEDDMIDMALQPLRKRKRGGE